MTDNPNDDQTTGGEQEFNPPSIPYTDHDDPYYWGDDNDPLTSDEILWSALPDFVLLDNDPFPYDEEEWRIPDTEQRGDPSEVADGAFIVDLTNIPEGYKLRAQRFGTREEAIAYLRRGHIINFGLVVSDPNTGLYSVAISDRSDRRYTPPDTTGDDEQPDSGDDDGEEEEIPF